MKGLPDKATELLDECDATPGASKRSVSVRHLMSKTDNFLRKQGKLDSLINTDNIQSDIKDKFCQLNTTCESLCENTSSSVLSPKTEKTLLQRLHSLSRVTDQNSENRCKNASSQSKNTSEESLHSNSFRQIFLKRLKNHLKIITTTLWVILHIATTSVTSLWYKVKTALHSIGVGVLGTCRKFLSSIIEVTPKNIVKYFMIYSCRVLPDLRNRQFVLMLFNRLPSRFTKTIVSRYIKNAPVWFVTWHASAFFKSQGPVRKLMRSVGCLLEFPRNVLETIFMATAGAFKTVSRMLTFSRGNEDQKLKRQPSSSLTLLKRGRLSSSGSNPKEEAS